MGWDDELEYLVSQVLDVFGQERVTEALLRAVRHLPRLPLSQDMLDFVPMERRHDAFVIDDAALAWRLKTELRNLLARIDVVSRSRQGSHVPPSSSSTRPKE
jgi:hypothetical protein